MKIHTKLLFLVCIGLFFIPATQFPDVCFAAGEPASFLLVGVEARSMGMGGAFTALVDDSSAVYWNPAGLGLLKNREFSGTYGSLFTDTTYSFMSYAQPVFACKKEKSRIALGVGWLQLRSLNIEKTNQEESLGETRMVNDAFFVSGSIQPVSSLPLYLGISGKRITQNIDTFSSEGWGMDLGMLLGGEGFLTWGVNIQNIGKTQIKGTSYWSDRQVKEVIPCHIRSGVVLKAKKAFSSLVSFFKEEEHGGEYSIYEPRISQNPQALERNKNSLRKEENESIDIKLNIAFEFDYIPDETDSLKFFQGIECWLHEIYGLRISFLDDFSAGASLKQGHFKIDYAFVFRPKLKDTHRFSLAILF